MRYSNIMPGGSRRGNQVRQRLLDSPLAVQGLHVCPIFLHEEVSGHRPTPILAVYAVET